MKTVGAALKKLAIAILGDEDTLKSVLAVLLAIVIGLLAPLMAIVALLSGGIRINTDTLVQLIEENMSPEDYAQMQLINDTALAIQHAMEAAGFASRFKEAQVLFILALSDHASEDDFVARLAGCFREGQTDAELVAAVNAEFGISFDAEVFTNIMNGIRAVFIDTSHYGDPGTKNNLDLVQYAIEAEQAGWGYVWGTYGTVLTELLLEALLEAYPDDIGEHEEFIRENWMGKRTADCVGFIKGYSWLEPKTHELVYGTNGMPDVSADGMYDAATEKGSIDTIPEIPGLAVWKEGHIGIYIGGGETIEAMGTRYGVVRRQLSAGSWTDWLKIPYINYIEEPEDPAPTETNETEDTP